ncbi:hypothetical protein MMC26_002434 [Xylographa opegraphella]|nr:hypothetical protein [Xylographa opegraphella]
MSERQALSRREVPFKGSLWAVPTVFAIPGDSSLHEIFLQAVLDLGNGVGGTEGFTLEEKAYSVGAEWNGYRISKTEQARKLSGQEQYDALRQDCSSETTVLYAHGGGYWSVLRSFRPRRKYVKFSSVGNPSHSRYIAQSVTKITGGSFCSVDYSLSPQNPFPAALYDIFLAYLSLLAPPPGSFHTPIAASSIVLAGDSSGGALSLALLQVLLYLKRHEVTSLPFCGRLVSPSLPAGIATLSAWCDKHGGLASLADTKNLDFTKDRSPFLESWYPPCSIWPAHPPRCFPYCDSTALCHPLVSPAVAEDWKDSPPMWFAWGEELQQVGCKAIASQAVKQGTVVQTAEYSGMPHIFLLLPGLGRLPQATHCLNAWGEFCRMCVDEPKLLKSRRTAIGYSAAEETQLQFNDILEIEFDEIKELMRKNMLKEEELYRRRQQSLVKL